MRNSPKVTVIRARVTQEEAKQFRENAKKYGCKTVSQFIRTMCLNPDAVKDLEVKSEVYNTDNSRR